MEVTSSQSNHYMRIPGKGMTTSMDLKTKSPNNKQKERFVITEITKNYFNKLLRNFYKSPYLCYKIKQFHNKPTEACLFLIKHITKLIKS